MATTERDPAVRPRRHTDTNPNNSSTMFRRMSAQAMGLEANALCHRSHWVPKSTRSSCSNCRRSFRLWTKKHHCRFCGEVVCRNCSTQRILIQKKTLRSCDACVSVNVQSISELSRRNSTSDLSLESAAALSQRSSVAGAGRKSDGALLRKSMQQQLRGKKLRGSLSKRESTTSRALHELRSRWRSQLPYVVVVFLLTVAGVLARV
ncbi:Zinc finger fyve domain-containing protein 16 [Globisporangium polare]